MSRKRYTRIYTTVAVTALPPGWHNHYQAEDGTIHTEPCPAILLQEHHLTLADWTEELPDGTPRLMDREVVQEPPFETRAVFASGKDDEIRPCADLEHDYSVGYLRTTGPGEPFPTVDDEPDR